MLQQCQGCVAAAQAGAHEPVLQRSTTCNMLQHAATCCNMLQHVAYPYPCMCLPRVGLPRMGLGAPVIGKDVRIELTRMRHGLLYPPVHDHLPQSCHAQAELRRRAVRKEGHHRPCRQRALAGAAAVLCDGGGRPWLRAPKRRTRRKVDARSGRREGRRRRAGKGYK